MSKCILVVEDREDSRQILRDLLAGTEYQLIEAENGEEAVPAVAKQRSDLIVMEIQLPMMDGYEAARRIKADPALQSIPIIAIPSYAPAGEEEKARAAGCDDCVPKPYSPRQLLGEDSAICALIQALLLRCTRSKLAHNRPSPRCSEWTRTVPVHGFPPPWNVEELSIDNSEIGRVKGRRLITPADRPDGALSAASPRTGGSRRPLCGRSPRGYC